MKRKLKVGTPILVHWHDAHWDGDMDIDSPDEIKNFRCELEDVGFFIMEKDNYLVMAHERGPTAGAFRHVYFVPIACILGMAILKGKKGEQ